MSHSPASPTSAPPPGPLRLFVRRGLVETALALVITIVVSLFAVGFNAIRGKERGGIDFVAKAPYELFAPCPEIDPALRTIPAASVDSEAGSGVLIFDARTAEEYVAGHIPGALPMPMYGHRPNLSRALPALISGRDQHLAFYGGAADDKTAWRLATWLRTTLRVHGLGTLWVLDGGYEAWTAAGRPVAATPVPAASVAALVKAPGVVLFVDAGDREEYVEGHLPGARWLRYHPLKPADPSSYTDLLQSQRPVVVYGLEAVDEELMDVEDDATERVDRGRMLAAVLIAMGAEGVSWLPGGRRAWEEAGGKMEYGSPKGGTP